MISEIKEKVLERLIYSAPNFVHLDHITRHLKEQKPEDINKAIELLLKEDKIKSTASDKHWHSDVAYRLDPKQNVPIRKVITVGDTEITRLLSTHVMQAAPEDINIAIEKLAEYAASLEEKSHKRYEEQIKKYWGNLVIIFGVFVAIFSLINVTIGRITLPSNFDFWQIVAVNTAQVLPVSLMIALFVLVLAKLFR